MRKLRQTVNVPNEAFVVGSPKYVKFLPINSKTKHRESRVMSDIERCLQNFEQAWQTGVVKSSLRDFLPPGCDEGTRRKLLCELVCIDLEYRLRTQSASASLCAEDYFKDYPELQANSICRLEIIAEEYRSRCEFDEAPRSHEMIDRFPNDATALAHRFAEIDRQRANEFETVSMPLTESFNPSSWLQPAVSSATVIDRTRAPLPFSDYLLQKLVGSGLMGKVYLAWQHSLDRPVAIKFLKKSFLNQPTAVERFLTEARIIARVSHPNIVGVHGLGTTDGGGLFLVMDWFDGGDLHAVARSRQQTPAEILKLMIDVCAGVAAAHQQGIVHCDLKPANILRAATGIVCISDFGMARILSETSSAEHSIEGTASYMAPEQVSAHWGEISPRTDVYGLGAVMYHLLTGRPPWTGSSVAEILGKVIAATVLPSARDICPDVPDAISEICAKCLKRHPSDRYQSVEELRQQLLALA